MGQSKGKVATRSYQPDLIGLIGHVPRLEFQALGRRDSTYVHMCICRYRICMYSMELVVYSIHTLQVYICLCRWRVQHKSAVNVTTSGGMGDCDLVDLICT